MRDKRTAMPILVAKGTTGVGQEFDVSDYNSVVLQLSAAASTTATVKVQGSLSNAAPTFSTARSAINHWDYLAVYDYETAILIEGGTGIAYSAVTAPDSCRNILINTDHLVWLNVEITSISAGDVTATAFAAQD